MTDISRRAFTASMFNSLLTYSLVKTLLTSDVLARSVKPITDQWLKEVYQVCADLKAHKLTALDWQKQIERLFVRIELSELLRLIDFERLAARIRYPEDRAATRNVHFPEVAGLPNSLSVGKKIFALQKGRAIVPHGHRNMVSGHIIIKGEMHVRHYERVRDEPKHILIKPTIDRLSKTGEATTISDDKDNVHWLIAKSETAFTFDLIMVNLNPTLGYPWEMDYIDPLSGEQDKEGLIRAPRLQAEESFKRFGRTGSN